MDERHQSHKLPYNHTGSVAGGCGDRVLDECQFCSGQHPYACILRLLQPLLKAESLRAIGFIHSNLSRCSLNTPANSQRRSNRERLMYAETVVLQNASTAVS